MNLNKVFLIGRLTQEPDARSTPSGQNVTTLRLATNRVWTNQSSGQKQEATEYHTVVAWGRLGEIASQYLKKGGLVMIEGRVQTRSWTGNDNVKRYMTEVIAENLQLGPRTGEARTGEAPVVADVKRGPSASSGQAAAPVSEENIPIINEEDMVSSGVEEETVKVKEEDLPF